ncbi:MAG TPA: substrate-binding domain-containing protein [Clostridiales bacterium]|nr:substrate-binding domain-containing protein [Clostridiales bacterium]
MKKKKILSALLALSMMFIITACGDKDKDSSSESKAQSSKTESSSSANNNDNNTAEIKSTGPNGETAVNATTLKLTDEEIDKIKAGKYKAAICLHYGGNDWSTSQVKGLTDTFKKLGIEIVATTDANFSAEQQVADIETIMALKPDILISIPTDAVATADAYQRAADSGIRIVFMDNVPSGFKAGKNYVSCVSADNYGNGIIAADLIGEALDGKGKIGVVFYDVDFFVTNQRLEAFEKTMKDKYPDIEVVSKMGFTDTNAASSVADAMLTQNPNINAIFAHWDVPCEGVLSSLRAGGYKDVKLSTIDLGNNIAKEIAEGTVLGLGAQLPYDQGVAEATLAAYSLLDKEAPAYVAVPAMRVDSNNIIDAYTKVYHVDAPDWLKEAAE